MTRQSERMMTNNRLKSKRMLPKNYRSPPKKRQLLNLSRMQLSLMTGKTRLTTLPSTLLKTKMTFSTRLRGTTAMRRRSSRRAPTLPKAQQTRNHIIRQPHLLPKSSKSLLPSIWLMIKPRSKGGRGKENYSQKEKSRPL